jgi:hypothetical protein
VHSVSVYDVGVHSVRVHEVGMHSVSVRGGNAQCECA